MIKKKVNWKEIIEALGIVFGIHASIAILLILFSTLSKGYLYVTGANQTRLIYEICLFTFGLLILFFALKEKLGGKEKWLKKVERVESSMKSVKASSRRRKRLFILLISY